MSSVGQGLVPSSHKTIRSLAQAFPLACLLLVVGLFQIAGANDTSERSFVRDRLQPQSEQHETIAGLEVAIWEPTGRSTAPAPVLIFSHGFKGANAQSRFIMRALGDAGYFVFAPNHKDAIGGGMHRPEVAFGRPSDWTDKTFESRHKDVATLLNSLRTDNKWKQRIDWTKVGLIGHSLGGYTVLGMGGAYPSWKLPGVKAIVALSPYCEPFIDHGNLGAMGVPVMYQGGTRDFGITPSVMRENGAFSKTSSPCQLVEFQNAGHFSWTNFNRDQAQQELINYYCVSFFDRFVKGDATAKPDARLAGVVVLETK